MKIKTFVTEIFFKAVMKKAGFSSVNIYIKSECVAANDPGVGNISRQWRTEGGGVIE